MKLYNVLMHKRKPSEHVLFIKLGDLNYRLDMDVNENGNFYIFLAKRSLSDDLTMTVWTNVPKGFIWKPF